jgi:hypothetical protein
MLTGKLLWYCWNNSEHQRDTIAKLADWQEIEYYLSDGGYSRLCIDPYAGRIFVTSNSLSGVKERWLSAPYVVARIVEEFEKAKVRADCGSTGHNTGSNICPGRPDEQDAI